MTYIATIKLLEWNQKVESYKQFFKAQFPDFYYRNSHLDCYRFYQ